MNTFVIFVSLIHEQDSYISNVLVIFVSLIHDLSNKFYFVSGPIDGVSVGFVQSSTVQSNGNFFPILSPITLQEHDQKRGYYVHATYP